VTGALLDVLDVVESLGSDHGKVVSQKSVGPEKVKAHSALRNSQSLSVLPRQKNPSEALTGGTWSPRPPKLVPSE
jgi:hypothetical protein